MTLLVFTFTTITILTAILCAMSYRHLFFLITPLLFIFGFVVTIESTNYQGYPVESRFIERGAEGLILSVIETSDAYLVLLKFNGDDEPRLVSFLKSEIDQEALQKAKAGRNNVLKFGSESGNEANGQEAHGERGVTVVPMNESEGFGK